MPRADAERMLERCPETIKAIGMLEALEGVRGVSKAKWIRQPHSRLAAGTIVPLGPEGQTYKAKIYTGKPDTGYIPLTLYLTKLTTPHQIGQFIEHRNRLAAEARAELRKDQEEEIKPPSKFSNLPRVEIAQPQAQRKAEEESVIAQPHPPASQKTISSAEAMQLLGLKSKSALAYYVKIQRLIPVNYARGTGHTSMFSEADVLALKANKRGPGAPPGGHQVKAMVTVEDRFDRMIDLLQTLTQQNAALLQANQELVRVWAS